MSIKLQENICYSDFRWNSLKVNEEYYILSVLYFPTDLAVKTCIHEDTGCLRIKNLAFI